MPDSVKATSHGPYRGLVIEEEDHKASFLVEILKQAGTSHVYRSSSIEDAKGCLENEDPRIVLVGQNVKDIERLIQEHPVLMRRFSILMVSELSSETKAIPFGLDGLVHVDISSDRIGDDTLNVIHASVKQREAFVELLERDEQLCSIVDSTFDVVFTLDAEQRHTGIYGAWLQDMDQQRERFLGRTSREILGDEAAKIHEENNLRALEGEAVSYEWHVPTDQGVRHYMTSLSPIRSGDSVKGVAGIARDITDRVEFEDALRRSEESFRTLLDFSPFSVIVHDLETMEVVYANPNAIEQSGFSSIGEMVEGGLEWADPPYSEADARRLAQAAIEEGPQSLQWLSASKDGTRFWEQISLMVLPFHGEERLLAVSVNIDDIKRLELSLRQTNKKMQLISGLIRHDVMNKITALRGFTELAIDSCDCGSLALLDRVEQSATAIQKDIEFMREYDRLGNEAPQWQKVQFSISSATVVGVGFERLINGLEVYADLMFGRVFENLIDNSIRHGGKVTRIGLSGHQDGEDFIMVWEDDGVGIPLADKERIFSRGFGKNTGFGLFLTRHILSLTGIRISEEGEEGEGVRFIIRVPEGMWRMRS